MFALKNRRFSVRNPIRQQLNWALIDSFGLAIPILAWNPYSPLIVTRRHQFQFMKVKVVVASIFSNENSILLSVLVSNLTVDSSLFPSYKSK